MRILSTSPTGKPLILNRGILFWISMTLLFVILIMGVYFFLTMALVKITHSYGTEARQSTVSIKAGITFNDTQPVSYIFGDYAFIPRSTKVLSAVTKDSETIKPIAHIPYFSIPEYRLTLEAQRKLQKLGSEGLGCNLTNQHGVFSHNCGDMEMSHIVRPDQGVWGAQPIADDGNSDSFSRYKEGFLAFDYLPSHVENKQTIFYIVPTGNSIELAGTFDLPEGFVKNEEDSIDIHTDSADPTAPFVVSNITQGTFLVIDDINDKEATQFTKKVSSDPTFDETLCDLTARQLACYYGPAPPDHTNTESHQEYRADHTKGSLEIRRLSDITSAKIYERTIDLPLDGLYQDGAGNIYATTIGTLYQFLTKDNSVEPITLTLGASDVESGRSLYFVRNDEGVYEYNSKEQASYLRFRSGHIIAGTLNNYGGEILLDGLVKTDDDAGIRNISQIYRVTDMALPRNEKRLEDFLPFGDADSSIANMDYDDTRIYVSIIPSFYRDTTEAKLHLDTKDNEAIKQRITERLQKDGALEGRRLIFNLFGTDQSL